METKNNPQLFWKLVKQGYCVKSTVDQVITIDRWSDYFENLFMGEDRDVRNDRDNTDLFDNIVPFTNSDCLHVPIS